MKCKWCGFDLGMDEGMTPPMGVCDSCIDEERERIAELAADIEDEEEDDFDQPGRDEEARDEDDE